MTRNLKMSGLALLALLAIGAIAAQGAAANENHSFTSEAEPTELTGTGGVHEWKLGKTVLKCNKVALTGFLATHSADELNLTPAFSECSLGGLAMTAENKGCKTAFDSDTSPNLATEKKEDAVVSLNCGHSGSLTFATSGEEESIIIHFFDTHPEKVPVNQELHGATYSVQGGEFESELVIKSHISGLKFVCTGVCEVLGLKVGTNEGGTTTGTYTVKGYSDAKHEIQVGIGLSSP